MTVERGLGEDADDQFPVGMRVLAVDDDPTCLLLLETLLRRCQYHVITTSQAITALKMLRENKRKFDLVISDVHMPDMDGFKLLELVGLEMDLPVIMLSANSDPKLVMKGITHGACDYLLKPVRIEELKNIWQHVIRRRKHDKRDQNNFDKQDKPHHGSVDPDQKHNKKRKDQDEDEDEDRDENGHENEDPTTQKKPRVVWSVELHRKFVAAVNQLGIDKAVPKKILDLMNVEKLTRENVASHLQKYRLYLRRISTVANQQANMVAALGGTDASYLQMDSLNRLGLHNLAGGQFQNTGFRSLPASGMLGRLNSPARPGIHSLSSAGVIQLGHLQTTAKSAHSQSHFQPVMHPGNGGNILQGMPTSLEFDQIRSNKGVPFIKELPSNIGDTTVFPATSGFPDAQMIVGSSNGSFLGVSNKPLMLEGHSQGTQDGKKFGKQSSFTLASLDSGFSTHFSDHGRCDDSWSSAVQSAGVQSNCFTLSDCFKQATLCPTNIKDSMSMMSFHGGSNPCDVSSISTLPIHLQDSKADLRCHGASISSDDGQIINNAPQGWDDFGQDDCYHSNSVRNSIDSTIPISGTGSPIGQNLDPNNTFFHRTARFSSTGQPIFVDPSLTKQNEIENLAMETLERSKEGYIIGQQQPQGNYGSLEDLACVVAKQEPDMPLTEAEFGYGAYSLRTCI